MLYMQSNYFIFERLFQIWDILTETVCQPFSEPFLGEGVYCTWCLHGLQAIFFIFLLLPQTSFLSTYTFSGPTLPVQQAIQTYLS